MSLSFRSVELQGDHFCLDIVRGLHEPAEVRGKDSVAPGRIGRYARNRIKDVRKILIEGYIRGVGSTLDERRESWHDTTATIMAAMERDLAAGVLAVDGGTYGLPAGETWTINARCVNAIGGPIRSTWTFQEWSIELESVDPDWEVSGS